MAASLSLVVLYPNGTRQSFHISPNTSVFQVLEDACKKQRLNPAEYELFHRERRLSHQLPVSFTNLPNHAELELRASGHRRSAATSVEICLQLESGERLVAPFPATASLLDVVAHWPDKTGIHDAGQKMDLVCVYMRKEIVGSEQLRDMTLQKLGLTSGKAAIRLLCRPKGGVVEQAHVSRHFAVPFKKESKSKSPTRPPQPTSPKLARPAASQQSPPRSKSPPAERSPAPKPAVVHTLADYARPSSPQNVPARPPAPSHPVAPASGHVAGTQARLSPPLSSSPPKKRAEVAVVREEDIKYIGERKAVLFNLEHCPPFVAEELGDSFYEVTLEDAKYLAADYRRQREMLENRPLETGKLREARNQKMVERYPVAVIRVYFPDRFVLQGTFQSEEQVADIMHFLRGFLRNGNQEFYLYTSPPKHVLDPGTTLTDANLVPASVVHFGGELTPGTPLLRDEVLALVSTPGGALAAASRLRSDVNVHGHPVPAGPAVSVTTASGRPSQRANTGGDGARSRSQSPPKSPPPKSPPPHGSSQAKVPKWFVMGKK